MNYKQWHFHNNKYYRVYKLFMRRRWIPTREAFNMAVGYLCLYKQCSFHTNTLGYELIKAAR